MSFTVWQHLCARTGATDIEMATATSPAQGSDPYVDRRAHPRVPVALPAFLKANGERHQAQILDLSAGGARLSCAALFATGTTAVLECGTLARAAVVRWQNDGLLGLCFETMLDEPDVAALADRSASLAVRMRNNTGLI
jgi:hypothetical protein